MDDATIERCLAWDLQEAPEPYDLSVSADERAEILSLHRWFSRFSPSEKLRILARQRRLARRLRDLGRACRR